jgi:ATP-dependent RNA helicase A
VTTISNFINVFHKAATTFSEPFVSEGRYLRMMHKNLAGRRHSDHVALLVAFYQWLKAKWRGEDAEREFCDRRSLNMQIMRMTYEAKQQLKDIMVLSGFPEECLAENLSYDVNNADAKLDKITSLLAYALYPNVCFHIDKRKLITADGKQALIHKNSVNCGREIASFPSPFFVFGEKIKTRAVSAKQMTMVTPAQLLMFASDKVETVPTNQNLVCLDGWIYLQMNNRLTASILSLRSAMDTFLVDCLLDQNQILNGSKHVALFTETFTMLSDLNNYHIAFSKVNESIAGLQSDAINTSSTNYNSKIYKQSSGGEVNFDLGDDNEDEMKYQIEEDNDEPQAKRFANSNNNSEECKTPFNSASSFGNLNQAGFGSNSSFGSFRGGRGGFRNNSFNNNNNSGGFNSRSGGGNGGCFKCGESGHFSRECPRNMSGGFNSGGRGGSRGGGFGQGFRSNNYNNGSGFGQQSRTSFNSNNCNFANNNNNNRPAETSSNERPSGGVPVPPHLMKQSPSGSGFDSTSLNNSNNGGQFNSNQSFNRQGFGGRGGGNGGFRQNNFNGSRRF